MGSNVSKCKTIIAGCDPGFKGGLAYIEYTPGLNDFTLLNVLPLPTCKIKTKARHLTAYNVPALRSPLNDAHPTCKTYIPEHAVHCDDNSKFSNIATEIGFGLIAGLIQSDPSKQLVEAWPSVWQSRMFRKICSRRKKGDTKELAERVALSVFPDAPIHGPRGGLLDGLSDAICIALYGTTVKQ